MADKMHLYTLILNEMLINDDIDNYLQFAASAQKESLEAVLAVTNFCLMRSHIPRVTQYVESVLDNFVDEDYRTHCRISQNMFMEIVETMHHALIYNHNGGSEQLSPKKQLLIFLCYMANHVTMREMGHFFGTGKSTIHETVIRVMEIFKQTFIHIIKWPSIQQQADIARDFQLQSGLPDVVGCLDSTHIRLDHCPEGDHDYINRKYFPSMQLQVVDDSDLLITDAYTGWPGSTHDARVSRNSSLYRRGEVGGLVARNKIVLGDSDYPLRNWLITPFPDNGHLNAHQRRFNRVFSSCRVTVERAIGHLKGRFRRLSNISLRSEHNIALTIICSCILHNMCILRAEDVEQYNVQDDGNNRPNQFLNLYRNNPDGLLRRQQLMQLLP